MEPMIECERFIGAFSMADPWPLFHDHILSKKGVIYADVAKTSYRA